MTVLERAGLTDLLRVNNQSFTVFAPTNEAFEKLSPEALESIFDDPEALKIVLLYHIANGEFRFDQLDNGVIQSLLEEDINVDVQHFLFWRTVRLNGQASIEGFEVSATNGVVHAIDHLLFPPAITR